MKCRECEHGRRHSWSAVWCVKYGIFISADHECALEGRKRRERDEDQRGEVGGETEILRGGGGTAGEVPGVLRGA